MKEQALSQQYRELDRDLATFYYKIGNYSEENRKIREKFIPNEDNMAAARETWARLSEQVNDLPEPDGVFSLVKHHLQDFVDSLEYMLDDAERHPESSYLHLDSILEGTARCNRQPDEERLGELLLLLRQLVENRSEMLRLIQERHTEREQVIIAKAMRETKRLMEAEQPRLREYFPTFTEEQHSRLLYAVRRICSLEEAMAEFLRPVMEEPEEEAKDDLSARMMIGRDEYRLLLKKRLGVSLDELLAWHKEEIEKTRADALALGRNLPISEPAPHSLREVSDILNKYAGPCETAEEMFERAKGYLVRTRAVAHEYVNLPEDEICNCVPICECCRDSYPWGGYEGGDFRVRPFVGQMFLNQYNVPAITDGWIKMNCMHEAYPGHHVQYVRTAIDETPETVKIGAKLVPLLEGTAIRTERAFQDVYAEDPFFPLFVAYRRHHASVRIYVDLMMYYYGATVGEAVQIYQDELGFDYPTARAQVQSHQYSPGYFTCYYYGLKKLESWEKEYGFSKKEFTELLFSAGYISIDRFGELLRLTPQERERYFHDFASLMRG